MATYSIDLGLDADAPGQNNVFPLQIELCSGELTHSGSGLINGFTPTALASFDEILSGDTIVFRVFNITGIGGSSINSFTGNPGSITFSFTVNPNSVGQPSVPFSQIPGNISSAGPQPCLSFASGPNTSWPCFYKLESGNNQLITHLVNPVTSPTSYQMSLSLQIGRSDSMTPVTYSVDPEMVVGPDPSGM